VLVVTSLHFGHQFLVPLIQRSGLANPAFRLRMPRVSPSAAMYNQDVPETMELSVLTEQVLPAKLSRGYIPDSHSDILTRYRVTGSGNAMFRVHRPAESRVCMSQSIRQPAGQKMPLSCNFEWRRWDSNPRTF
jgi:hypothetical protein